MAAKFSSPTMHAIPDLGDVAVTWIDSVDNEVLTTYRLDIDYTRLYLTIAYSPCSNFWRHEDNQLSDANLCVLATTTEPDHDFGHDWLDNVPIQAGCQVNVKTLDSNSDSLPIDFDEATDKEKTVLEAAIAFIVSHWRTDHPDRERLRAATLAHAYHESAHDAMGALITHLEVVNDRCGCVTELRKHVERTAALAGLWRDEAGLPASIDEPDDTPAAA
ncbi:hypothetical protein [Salininema proteolyticum]|uniref:Uncharacterized protein n=1 Tax=Salininema proteolyticum TaxID=1607685 RepID=A0ABV8U4K1_9ACTN